MCTSDFITVITVRIINLKQAKSLQHPIIHLNNHFLRNQKKHWRGLFQLVRSKRSRMRLLHSSQSLKVRFWGLQKCLTLLERSTKKLNQFIKQMLKVLWRWPKNVWGLGKHLCNYSRSWSLLIRLMLWKLSKWLKLRFNFPIIFKIWRSNR